MGSKEVEGTEQSEESLATTPQNTAPNPTHPILKALDKAIATATIPGSQRVAKLRSKNPNASKRELAAQLEQDFRNSVTVTGIASGATSAAPGVGTLAGLAAAGGDATWFSQVHPFTFFRSPNYMTLMSMTSSKKEH